MEHILQLEWDYTNKLRNLVEECSETYIKEYKDEIIEKTSDKLAERLIKTKAIKDMVNKAVSDLMNWGGYMTTKYVAYDGKEFDNPSDCKNYEKIFSKGKRK